METNVEPSKVTRISKEPSPLQTMTDQEQQENVEYSKYLRNVITNYARCAHEIKSSIAMAETTFNRTKILH